MKKLLLQKMAQLFDKMPVGKKRDEVKKDYLKLKLSKEDKFYLSMENKYKKLL